MIPDYIEEHKNITQITYNSKDQPQGHFRPFVLVLVGQHSCPDTFQHNGEVEGGKCDGVSKVGGVEQWDHPGGSQKFTGVMVGGEQNLLLGMNEWKFGQHCNW
jgi:hypothetical protein